MPNINPGLPGSPEGDAKRQIEDNPMTLSRSLGMRLMNISRSWVLRQAMKASAAVGTWVTAKLMANTTIDADTRTQIALGAGAMVIGLVEVVFSYIDAYVAPRAKRA